MAVTCTVVRNRSQQAVRGGSTEFCTASLTGTYNSGFTFNPAVKSGLGSSPEVGTTVLAVQWFSPTGYIYVTTTTKAGFGNVSATKIFSAPGTELTTGAALPDSSVPIIITKTRE